jgi:two-component system LytT family response regulator
MIRVLIVDDEPPARRKVRRGLERDADIGEIREAGSGEEAIAALRDFAPDLVFLDVQMPGIDGFGVLDAAPAPRDFHVVFLTAHEHHALRAFEAEALDYLLKPVDPERFDRALDRAKEQVRLRTAPAMPDRTRPFLRRLLVQTHTMEIFLPVERIDWAEAAGNYVDLHAAGNVYTVRTTLDQLVRQLDPDQFVRVNRSQLVNLDSVKELQPWFHGERLIVLKDGRELTWTRRFRTARAASSLRQARSSR